MPETNEQYKLQCSSCTFQVYFRGSRTFASRQIGICVDARASSEYRRRNAHRRAVWIIVVLQPGLHPGQQELRRAVRAEQDFWTFSVVEIDGCSSCHERGCVVDRVRRDGPFRTAVGRVCVTSCFVWWGSRATVTMVDHVQPPVVFKKERVLRVLLLINRTATSREGMAASQHAIESRVQQCERERERERERESLF